ncbi:hypothetical protein [Halobaculum lipolyticum]|uniref:Rubrerythrin-like domain-containing protein n=1 Tax=Halobaculum lipolyticum TaxID=3032001 RepID=A0ABD5WCX2_9EURY|nr:hypothetical protein [Halobaculum sp. DT31]
MQPTPPTGGEGIDHYECRHCGLTVTARVHGCPLCGRSIVHYSL